MAAGRRTTRAPWIPHPYAQLLIALLIACLLISLAAGRPDSLPAVALGSALLLYLERAVALFAGALLLVVILVEAWRGNLPVEISGRGIKYERLKQETRDGLKGLYEAIAEERKEREGEQGEG